jgi:hypothetical protein
MSKFGEPFGLSFENEEQALSPAASIVPPASPIGRPFGLTFGEAEPNGGVFDSTSGAPTPETAEPTPPVLAEPPSSTSNSTLQPTAVPGERERRLARAEADYQRAVYEAMRRLARDDGRAATILEIARHNGWTNEEAVERVNRDYVREERDYRVGRPYHGNQRQRYMFLCVA